MSCQYNQIQEYLDRLVKKNTVPQSLLFTGERLGDIAEIAKTFASELAGPADIHEYVPEGKVGMHSIETMRQFSEEVYLVPFNSQRKVFIIHHADRMLPTSANALLKTFEEPAKTSIIILTAKRSSSLLPTILSRCTTVRFPGQQAPTFSEPMLKILSKGHFKTYQELKDAASEIGSKHAEMMGNEEENLVMQATVHAQEIFNTILYWYRDVHLLQAKGDKSYLFNPNYVQELEKTQAIPLEKVQKILADAKLSLERFTSLTMVLERVFLELDFM